MELREWIILLGLVLIAIIVFDVFRRYRKQQEIPRLDEQLVDNESDAAKSKAMDWELPNGGARVVGSKRVAAPDMQESMFERRGLKTRIPFTQEAALSSIQMPASSSSNNTAATAGIGNVPESATPVADASAPHHQAGDAGAAAAGSEPATPASAPESHSQQAVEQDEDSEAFTEEERRARRGFFDSEEEEVDDPRYEGLSEILVKRPMDGVARFQEAAAERREKRAVKREEARVKRHEERARRAEEKERRRKEREEEQRRREEEQRQREAEARQREQEEMKQRRQREAEQAERQREQNEHHERLRREYEEQERARHAHLREADAAQRDQDHDDARDEDDPLFAPSRRDYGEGDEPQDAAARRGVPYLGAVDTYDEGRYDSREPSPRQSTEPYADDEVERSQYREQRSAPADDHAGNGGHADHSERNWVRDLPEPESRMHPIVERALRHSVNGEEAMDVLGDAEELIMINVVAQPGVSFAGLDLTRLLLACGLEFSQEGEMFHRFETEDPESALQFSVINALKPGRFPMLDIEKFSTRCISFLLPLPSAEDSTGAFEAMYETAKVVVRNLQGEMRDENQSVMTVQTVDFVRQRVTEFERRRHLYRHSR